jgi:hypothetical protein
VVPGRKLGGDRTMVKELRLRFAGEIKVKSPTSYSVDEQQSIFMSIIREHSKTAKDIRGIGGKIFRV